MQHGLLRNRQAISIEKFDGGLWSVMQSRTCALVPKIPLVPTLQSYIDMRIKVAGPTVPVFCQWKIFPEKVGNWQYRWRAWCFERQSVTPNHRHTAQSVSLFCAHSQTCTCAVQWGETRLPSEAMITSIHCPAVHCNTMCREEWQGFVYVPSSLTHPQIASSDRGTVGQPKRTSSLMFWERACMISPFFRRAGCTTARSAEGNICLLGSPSIWLEPGAYPLSTVSATRMTTH
jgi:hypothetical protein